ncbi:WXG100 family type VII secretion target [Saccharopolyspora sp. NPDC000359]|uniref:WXG100 family type VII secretion target n=1 Tax=Saccharopolyspora sp. NPDC000359 TaxID=3154251 RepID=UPI0033300709
MARDENAVAEHLDYLRRSARELDFANSIPAQLADLVGHHEDLREAARTWRKTADAIEQATGDVQGRLGGIDSAWQGADADAFLAHIREVGLAGHDLIDAMRALADVLEHTVEGVQEQVDDLSDLVAEAADSVSAALLDPEAGPERARKHLGELAKPALELAESISDTYRAFARFCEDLQAGRSTGSVQFDNRMPAQAWDFNAPTPPPAATEAEAVGAVGDPGATGGGETGAGPDGGEAGTSPDGGEAGAGQVGGEAGTSPGGGEAGAGQVGGETGEGVTGDEAETGSPGAGSTGGGAGAGVAGGGGAGTVGGATAATAEAPLPEGGRTAAGEPSAAAPPAAAVAGGAVAGGAVAAGAGASATGGMYGGMMPMGGMMGGAQGAGQDRKNQSRLKSKPEELFGTPPETAPPVFGASPQNQNQPPQEPVARKGKLDLPSVFQSDKPRKSIDDALHPKTADETPKPAPAPATDVPQLKPRTTTASAGETPPPKPKTATASVGDAPPPKPRTGTASVGDAPPPKPRSKS